MRSRVSVLSLLCSVRLVLSELEEDEVALLSSSKESCTSV